MDIAGRTILITGAGGFIGRAVVQALLQHGAYVRALLGPEDRALVRARWSNCEPTFATLTPYGMPYGALIP